MIVRIRVKNRRLKDTRKKLNYILNQNWEHTE